ncbi:MAG TPA: hypothetical protein VK978_04795 [Candidatus Saccharimonadales bacterium]|nr:hypothetical protein [Candidatus Saccharimonadales bacterium]
MERTNKGLELPADEAYGLREVLCLTGTIGIIGDRRDLRERGITRLPTYEERHTAIGLATNTPPHGLTRADASETAVLGTEYFDALSRVTAIALANQNPMIRVLSLRPLPSDTPSEEDRARAEQWIELAANANRLIS